MQDLLPDGPLELVLLHALVFIVAALLSLAVCRLACALALRRGMVSRRDARRAGPGEVPLLGGLGVLAGLAGGLILGHAIWSWWPLDLPAAWAVGPVLLVIGFGITGLLDDRHRLPVPARLVAELVVALAAIILLATAMAREFEGDAWAWGPLLLSAIGVTAGANAYNMSDNTDGVAAGTGAITFLGLAALTLPICGRTWVMDIPPLLWFFGPVPVAAAGALVGFLYWNRPRARIYLGDLGTLSIGSLLSLVFLLTIFFAVPRHGLAAPLRWLSLALICGYTLFDPLYAVIGRLAHGRAPWVGGIDHPTHHLRARFPRWTRAWMAILGGQALSVVIGVAVLRGWLPPGALAAGLLPWAALLLATGRGR